MNYSRQQLGGGAARRRWGGDAENRPSTVLGFTAKMISSLGVSLHPAVHLPSSPLSSRRSGTNPSNSFLSRSRGHTRLAPPPPGPRRPSRRRSAGPGPGGAPRGRRAVGCVALSLARVLLGGRSPCSGQSRLRLPKAASHVRPTEPHVQFLSLASTSVVQLALLL